MTATQVQDTCFNESTAKQDVPMGEEHNVGIILKDTQGQIYQYRWMTEDLRQSFTLHICFTVFVLLCPLLSTGPETFEVKGPR